MATETIVGPRLFDGHGFLAGPLTVSDGKVAGIGPYAPCGGKLVELDGGILVPGFVDLQVNGGDGLMLNDAPTVETLARMARAHAGLGATALFPTLITDTDAVTRATVTAVAEAARRLPAIAGLHLEGPHLSLARKGAHDPALIRSMTDADVAFLIDAAAQVPRLLVTLAPESVTDGQILALAKAGVIVSLGHTDTGYDRAKSAISAGAQVATHLFNAMSQLGNREPGLVGAVLDDGRIDCGLIADGIHVHPATIRAALAAKAGPGEVYLVTDAMAPAGTLLQGFRLNGREIRRQGGRLTLVDGTLAGADLDFPRALRFLVRDVGVPLLQALAMATRIPARVGRISDQHGTLRIGRPANVVHLSDDLLLRRVWQNGAEVELAPTE